MTPPTVQVGSKGPAVQQAQQALLDRGYPVGSPGADGIFGIHTRSAVLRYQADRSAGSDWAFTYPLQVDGLVGPQTWGRLSPDTIRNGDKGTGVRLAQSILKSTGYPPYDPGAVDGIFGPQTELAVTNFQTDITIKADGIVGPETWTALWS
jgi:peptidoglycan hydrolase-like protein with peptidoglycan-binding domain